MSSLNIVSSNAQTEKQEVLVRTELPIANSRPLPDVTGLRRETIDVLKRLELNVNSVDELTSRLGFMMSELRGLVRK